MRLLVATRSRGKQAEFRSALSSADITVVFPDELGFAECAEESELEIHDTFAANAHAKAAFFAASCGMPALADDSGLAVDALLGAPGVRSKRFAGVSGSEEDVTAANNALLLERLHGLPPHARGAQFRCALSLVGVGAKETRADGVVRGRIIETPRGIAGFGYDPLFYCDELGCTFGEAEAAAKHRVSHRGRAIRAMAAVLGSRG
ncbi:MAG: non-canonical purine NTP pyrophosphatase [Gemmatimonadales bacterium]